MAQIKSAEKRNRQKDRHRARNRLVLGDMRAALKRARTAVTSKEKDGDKIVLTAVKLVDSAASKGVIKKKTASRLISRLTRKRSA